MKLEAQVKQDLTEKLADYCEQELNLDLGQFELEFFLEFILKELAPQVYNQALYDAELVLKDKLEDILMGLEK